MKKIIPREIDHCRKTEIIYNSADFICKNGEHCSIAFYVAGKKNWDWDKVTSLEQMIDME